MKDCSQPTDGLNWALIKPPYRSGNRNMKGPIKTLADCVLSQKEARDGSTFTSRPEKGRAQTGQGIIDPDTLDPTLDQFATEIVSQIYEGAWGTDVRAGIIGEIGCQAPWTDLEKCVMRGALIAQQETGAALNVHPGRHPDQPQEVVDFVTAHGGDPTRLIISYIDRTIFDDERLFRLDDSGCTLELDLFGQEQSLYSLDLKVDLLNDAGRLHSIRQLIDRGHLEQITMSHDICYRARLVQFGGHGYGHIFENVVPLMRRRGFSEDEIEQITIEMPKRLLTFN